MTDWVWGIDTGPRVGAIAVIELDTGRQHTNVVTWPTPLKLREGTRWLAGMRDAWTRFVTVMASDFPPLTIAVEMPSTHNNPDVSLAAGATLSAVAGVLMLPEPWRIAVGTWKRVAVGHGNASKTQVLAWAHRNGLRLDARQDEADALAIAWAARIEMYGDGPTPVQSSILRIAA